MVNLDKSFINAAVQSLLRQEEPILKVTIKDIAQAAGLSPATVSLVLNDRPSRISEETKERIRSLAQELNYRPNTAAVNLRTNRSYTIGIIIPDFINAYHCAYAKGVEDACQEADWSVILCSTNYNLERELKYVETLLAKGVDGICIAATPSKDTPKLNDLSVERIISRNIPLVMLDLTSYREPINAVVSDHKKGGYMATSHLLALGHRKIAFITGPAGLEGSASRVLGCQQAFADYGLPWDPSLVYEGDFSYNSGLTGIDYLCDKNFTAVFAFNDMMAYGVYNGLEKYNLKVPEDISVVGYDDIFLSDILSVPLTTVHQPIYEMGQESARILIRAAENVGAKPVISHFDLQLKVRRSTRKLENTD